MNGCTMVISIINYLIDFYLSWIKCSISVDASVFLVGVVLDPTDKVSFVDTWSICELPMGVLEPSLLLYWLSQCFSWLVCSFILIIFTESEWCHLFSCQFDSCSLGFFSYDLCSPDLYPLSLRLIIFLDYFLTSICLKSVDGVECREYLLLLCLRLDQRLLSLSILLYFYFSLVLWIFFKYFNFFIFLYLNLSNFFFVY